MGMGQELQYDDLFQNPDEEQERLESILQEVVMRNYDYIMRIEAETGYFRMYGHGNEDGYFPMESGIDYEAMCTRYHPLVAYPEDQKKLEYYTQLSTVEAKLRETNHYSFNVRTINLDGTIAWKRYSYSYLDRMRRILFLTRRDVTLSVVQEQNRQMEETRLQEEWKQLQKEQQNFYARLDREICEQLDEIDEFCQQACHVAGKRKAGMDGKEPAHRLFAQVNDSVTGILKAEEHIRRLLKDTEDLGRFGRGEARFEEVPVFLLEEAQVLRGLIEPAVTAKKGRLEWLFDERLSQDRVIVDKEKFEHALKNVLALAAETMEPGGKVTVAFLPVRRMEECIHLRMSIGNTGGIWKEEEAEKLVWPFHHKNDKEKKEEKGSSHDKTGLELTVAKNIIACMKGTLQVRPAVCGGLEIITELHLKRKVMSSED